MCLAIPLTPVRIQTNRPIAAWNIGLVQPASHAQSREQSMPSIHCGCHSRKYHPAIVQASEARIGHCGSGQALGAGHLLFFRFSSDLFLCRSLVALVGILKVPHDNRRVYNYHRCQSSAPTTMIVDAMRCSHWHCSGFCGLLLHKHDAVRRQIDEHGCNFRAPAQGVGAEAIGHCQGFGGHRPRTLML